MQTEEWKNEGGGGGYCIAWVNEGGWVL